MSQKLSNKKERIRRTKKRRKLTTRIAVFSFLAIIVIILVISYSRQRSTPPPPKKPSSEYFKIYPGSLIGNLQEDNETWKVYTITFTVQPIGGDANNVIIESWAMGDPVELEDMEQGQVSNLVTLDAEYPDVVTEDSEGKIPIDINVKCDETDPTQKNITVLFSSPLAST